MRESDAVLAWIDFRVFWNDMPYKRVNPYDHRIVQSPRPDLPIDLWVNCIELTFNGANINDECAVYDQMFNCHHHHESVKRAIKCANTWLASIGDKLC